MPQQEACVLDPAEFIPERVELDLDSMGLAIRAEGVDWGESAVAQQLQPGPNGEVPTDSELTNVEITIPIRVMAEGSVSLAEASYMFQQKAGLIQKRWGWARRDFDTGGGFAGSIGYRVVSASFSGLDGWLFANRQDAPDVILKMSRWPLGYSTEEVVETLAKSVANLIANPSFETDTTGWSITATGWASKSIPKTAASYEGSSGENVLRVNATKDATATKRTATIVASTAVGSITPGAVYSAAFAMKAYDEPVAEGWSFQIDWYTAASAYISSSPKLTIPSAGSGTAARRVLEGLTAPANASFANFIVQFFSSTSGDIVEFDIDAALLHEGATIKPFFEGDERQLIATYSDTKGSGEGLERWTIENLGTAPWRGLILAKEHYSLVSGPTAEPIYAAADLTPKGGAEVKTISGTKLVQHTSLTAGWITILSSEIAGVGHMAHHGPKRLKFRIFDPGAVAGGVELHLLWRTLGSSRWSGEVENPIVATPLVGDFAIIDAGEARPQIAALGDDRFEWKLLARAPGGEGAIRVHLAEVLSTEQVVELSEPYVPPAADAQAAKSPGTVTEDESIGSIAWGTPTNVKVADGNYATVTHAKTGTDSYGAKLTGLGFGFSESVTILGIGVVVKCKSDNGQATLKVRPIKAGVVDNTGSHSREAVVPTAVSLLSLGGSADLLGNAWTGPDISASNFGIEIQSRFHALHTLSEKTYVDQVQLVVYYTEGPEEDRVCFAERSVEIRSNGAFRQAPEDDVWGRLVEDSSLPTATPSGMEGLATRAVIIPSQGDLQTLADTGTNKLQVTRRYRAGYHFAREAA